MSEQHLKLSGVSIAETPIDDYAHDVFLVSPVAHEARALYESSITNGEQVAPPAGLMSIPRKSTHDFGKWRVRLKNRKAKQDA